VETGDRTPPGDGLRWDELRNSSTVDDYAEMLALTGLTALA